MSRKKHRLIKRLQNLSNRRQPLKNLPVNIINKNLFDRSKLNYNKYFDYPLSQLIADHSTDPMQNTAKPYILLDNSTQGRFLNHEMIIRKNGETTIHRPKQDIVLVKGFTQINRPSYSLLSYQLVPLHPQIASSSSIINKMSIAKSEQTIINKRKHEKRRRRRERRKKKSIRQNVDNNNQVELVLDKTLCDIKDQRVATYDRSLIEELEDICFNRTPQLHKDDMELSFDLL